MATSWLERWRLATSIPPAMAGGGSDPCRGSTAKMTQWKNPDIPSLAFSSLPRFIRDDSRGAPLLSNAIHALGRVKLRQASGVCMYYSWGDGKKPVIQSPLSPGIPRRYPELLRSSRDMAPVAGTRAVWPWPWPWETLPGLPARRPKLPQILHPRRKTTHPITHQGTKSAGDGAWGKTQVCIASTACT